MKYLETKHEQNSAKITALIAVILVLLLFVMGNTYMDPPEEYGVAINFGNSEVGSGNIQPTEPIKSRINEEVVKEDKQTEKVEEVTKPTEASSNAEDVMTSENAEAIAIKMTCRKIFSHIWSPNTESLRLRRERDSTEILLARSSLIRYGWKRLFLLLRGITPCELIHQAG